MTAWLTSIPCWRRICCSVLWAAATWLPVGTRAPEDSAAAGRTGAGWMPAPIVLSARRIGVGCVADSVDVIGELNNSWPVVASASTLPATVVRVYQLGCRPARCVLPRRPRAEFRVDMFLLPSEGTEPRRGAPDVKAEQ